MESAEKNHFEHAPYFKRNEERPSVANPTTSTQIRLYTLCKLDTNPNFRIKWSKLQIDSQSGKESKGKIALKLQCKLVKYIERS